MQIKISKLSNPKLKIYIILVLISFLIGVATWINFKSNNDKHDFSSWPTVTTKPAPPITKEQALQLSQDMRSGKEEDLRAAVVLPKGQKIKTEALEEIKSLGTIVFDHTTFKDNKDGTATITALVQNPLTGMEPSWNVTLLNVDGHWKISFTEPIQ